MAAIRWKLRETLKRLDINPYALARAMGDQRKAVTLYRLASPSKTPSRIDLGTLSEIITALRRVTGEPVTIADLLEVVEEPDLDKRQDEPPAWQSLVGLLDDSAFPADSVSRIEQDLGESLEQEMRDSLAGKR